MRHLYYPLFLILLLLSACKKNDTEPDDERAFVAGEVAVGFQPNGSLAAAFDLVNSQGLTIKSMSGFAYKSHLPNSSLAAITAEVQGKSYFSNGGSCSVQIFSTDNKIHVLPTFAAMPVASQQDWLATVTKLQLTPDLAMPWMLLQVPAGQEKRWVANLAGNGLVKWSELNHIGGRMVF